ncbi:MAG: 6-phosphogluconolactonase [Anaeromyxobacteraceae bacterium]
MAEPVTAAARRVAPDAAALMHVAAEEVASRAASAVQARGRFTIALSGGSTPRALYALLADPAAPFRARVPWDAVQVFFGDERHVPPDHADSNYRMAREALLGLVPIRPESVHRVRGELPDADEAALEYEAELSEAFALREGERPRLDVALMGMGPDGHTASLFPGSAALGEEARLVVAPYVPKFGVHRVTLTLPVFAAARAVVFLVAGADKAERVAEVLGGRAPQLPAARVRPEEGELLWLLDAAAATSLLRVP